MDIQNVIDQATNLESLEFEKLVYDMIIKAKQKHISDISILKTNDGKIIIYLSSLSDELQTAKTKRARPFGIAKGVVKYMAADFNEPLDDLADKMY
jgi:hypothetical protein